MLIKKTFFIETGSKKEKITANILDFPNLVQPNTYSCGAVCVQSVLWYYGNRKRQECVLEKVLDVDKDEWTETKNMIKFLKKEKFKVDMHQMTVDELEWYVKRWIPVIVPIQARSDKKVKYANVRHEGHFIVVVGYNKKNLFFSDPVTCHTCYLPKKEFLERWHDIDNKQKKYNDGIAIYGKKPKHDSLSLRKTA